MGLTMHHLRNAGIYCLVTDRPLWRMARAGYRGLARRTIFDFLCLCREHHIEGLPASQETHIRIWVACHDADSAGFSLMPLPDSNEFIVELKKFVSQIRWNKVSVELQWRFELMLAIRCESGASATEAMQKGQGHCASFPILSGVNLEWLGFDLIEQSSTWSALAMIGDWKGPTETLNSHGLCQDMHQMSRLRELYFQSDDEDRAPKEEYHVFGVMKLSIDI